MALTKRALIIAMDYWKIQKVQMLEDFADLVEDSADNPTIENLEQVKKLSRDLDNVELVITRVNQLLTKY